MSIRTVRLSSTMRTRGFISASCIRARASAPSTGAICSRGRTCSAAPSRIASSHAKHHRRRFVWAIVLPPATPYGQEALGSIAAHPREEAGRTAATELLRQGSEENIDRRPQECRSGS